VTKLPQTIELERKVKERKGKERKSIYIAPFRTKRSGMDHTVLPANNTMPWRSPDVATTATEAADIQFIDLESIRG